MGRKDDILDDSLLFALQGGDSTGQRESTGVANAAGFCEGEGSADNHAVDASDLHFFAQ